MPSYPKNYPFYNWVPKPVGIIIMLLLFIPILTVGGVYSVNSTEMMSGLGIISEHIQFTNFVTSIGMAAFAPFLYRFIQTFPELSVNTVPAGIRILAPIFSLVIDLVKVTSTEAAMADLVL